MTNRKTTKRALISSVLALMLCFAMLLGSTYAWFTDTATTKVNTIQSGILDVELLDADTHKTLEGEALTFKTDGAGYDNGVLLWEPGATHKTNSFYVKNNGNLALKYKVVITGIDATDSKLMEVMTFYLVIGNNKYAMDGVPADLLLKANDRSSDMYIEAVMNQNAGNEYQGLSADSVAVTVYATQAAHENDANGNTYDSNAEYSELIIVNDAGALQAALADSNATVMLGTDITINGEQIKVDTDKTIILNGNDLNMSANTSRPFEMSGDATLTIKGDANSTVTVGTYGLANIPAASSASVVLDGGNYVANTDNGAFIKVRSGAVSANIVLNNVNYVDNSTNGFVMNADGFEGAMNLVVNGGTYAANAGFQTMGVAEFNDVTVTTNAAAFEVCGIATFNNCTITVGNSTVGTAPAAAIAVSSNGTAYVNDCKITATGNAFFVYSSGGTIIANNTTGNVTFDYVVDLNSYPDAIYRVVIDGVTKVNE